MLVSAQLCCSATCGWTSLLFSCGRIKLRNQHRSSRTGSFAILFPSADSCLNVCVCVYAPGVSIHFSTCTWVQVFLSTSRCVNVAAYVHLHWCAEIKFTPCGMFCCISLADQRLSDFLGTTRYAERNRVCRKTHSLLSLSLVALPCMCSHAHLGFLTETHEEMFPQTHRYVYTPPPACIRSYRKARTCFTHWYISKCVSTHMHTSVSTPHMHLFTEICTWNAHSCSSIKMSVYI